VVLVNGLGFNLGALPLAREMSLMTAATLTTSGATLTTTGDRTHQECHPVTNSATLSPRVPPCYQECHLHIVIETIRVWKKNNVEKLD
jgi:hypothetical protein